MNYQFPSTVYVATATFSDQMNKIIEETLELSTEVRDSEKRFNADLVIEEALDLIQSVETLLRKFPEYMVAKHKAVVINKNLKRGYYGDSNNIGGTD